MGNELLAHYYTKYNTTQMMEYDLKHLKKLNNLWQKLHRTEKLIYIFEIINIFKMINNYMDINSAKCELLEYVDDEYKNNTKFIIENIENLNIDILRENNVISFN